MERVYFFHQSEDFQKKVQELFETENARIDLLIPNAEIDHVGATAVPGAITKCDLDIQVRVSDEQFEAARQKLESLYEINQPENWCKSFASFKENQLYELPVGVQLVVASSAHDFFTRSRDILIAEPRLLVKLNTMKWRFHGQGMDEYRAAKANFFEQLLSEDNS